MFIRLLRRAGWALPRPIYLFIKIKNSYLWYPRILPPETLECQTVANPDLYENSWGSAQFTHLFLLLYKGYGLYGLVTRRGNNTNTEEHCVVHWKSTQVSQQQVASVFRVKCKPSKKPTCCLLHADLSLGLFFSPEGKGKMFIRNVGWITKDYSALYPKG
jgi:hypothetical protein